MNNPVLFAIAACIIILIIIIVIIVLIALLYKRSSSSSGYPPDPTQTATVRIKNSCNFPLWIEARAGPNSATLPGQSNPVTELLPNGFADYNIPEEGLVGARWWAKYGCDSNGENCLIGQQVKLL